MDNFLYKVDVRWADIDANYHLRHSIYYDYGAYCRMQYLAGHAITTNFLQLHNLGPIIFREECVFKREIKLEDKVEIDIKLVKATRDFSKWTMQHTIFKNNEIVAAIITLDGAWIDTAKRKLAVPPQQICTVFELAPKTEDFIWL